jgi:alkanesulfonate monooxygenase SsuD/methylene tetrahydromethanopterin reductase-like flavin-dependent oxidoreductase (luciferase family)
MVQIIRSPDEPIFEPRSSDFGASIILKPTIRAALTVTDFTWPGRTLRLVAQYADACNFMSAGPRTRELLDVLERHCADVGRDPAQITGAPSPPSW